MHFSRYEVLLLEDCPEDAFVIDEGFKGAVLNAG
jgi:hypothetical protein